MRHSTFLNADQQLVLRQSALGLHDPKMPKLMHQNSNPVRAATRHYDHFDSGASKDIVKTGKKMQTMATTNKEKFTKRPSLTIDLNAESLKGAYKKM